MNGNSWSYKASVNKRHHTSKTENYRMAPKFCQLCIWWKLSIYNIKRTKKLNIEKENCKMWYRTKQLSKEKRLVSEKHLKCSMSLGYKNMKINSTLKFHLSQSEQPRSRKQMSGCGSKHVENGEYLLIHCWWKCKPVHIIWKSLWMFLQELEINLPQDLAIALWTYTPKAAIPYAEKVVNLCSLRTINKSQLMNG